MAELKVKFWDCGDPEQLYDTDLTDAVRRWVEDRKDNPHITLPETVKVYGYAPMELPPAERQADWLLGDLIERLDEEYGDPSETTKPTDAMKAAALAFAQAIHAEYPIWACEVVTSLVVKIADHVPSEWLTPSQSAVEDPSSRSPRTEGET